MWTLSRGDPAPAATAERELTQARSRRFTFRLDGACDGQFSIDGRSDEAAGFVSLASDVWCWRDGVLMLRGRCGAESDTLSEDIHTTTYQIVDYRGMLNYRRVVDSAGAQGVTFTTTSQATLAWDLILWTQALSGGNWGITDGLGNVSATTRDRTIDAGAFIGPEIALVGRLTTGFEWEISPTLAFNRWYPTRGADNGVVLDYGGVITNAQRQQNPGDFANSVLVTGTEGLTIVKADSATIGSDTRGRWELVESFPSIIEQATLNARATSLVAQSEVLRATWSVTLAQGVWRGSSHIWVGDTVHLAVKSGRFNFSTAHRVVEVQVEVGDSGEETVTLALVEAP